MATTQHQVHRSPLCVLLVGLDPTMQASLTSELRPRGHEVVSVSDADQLAALAPRAQLDVVVCDPRAPNLHRSIIAHRISRHNGNGKVVFVGSGVRTVDTPLQAVTYDSLVSAIESTANGDLHAAPESSPPGDHGASDDQEVKVVGESPALQDLKTKVRIFAASNASVLITGESGTGKELVARALHRLSTRCGFPFVAVNCAAVPETLLESEFFGHERGAFTGAVARRAGRFVAAQHGTLFLDEVAELPLAAQAKLLRALESGVVEPLGSSKSQSIDVRVISATHRCMQERVARSLLREDLYYRLKVLHVEVPPLRARGEDLRLLARYFVAKYSGAKPPSQLTQKAWDALFAYPFPGNVRELAHAIEHACVLAAGAPVDVHHLPPEISAARDQAPVERDRVRALASAVQEFERQYLLHALRLAGGQRTRAAELLRISRKNLWEKIRRHHIEPDEFEAITARPPHGADRTPGKAPLRERNTPTT